MLFWLNVKKSLILNHVIKYVKLIKNTYNNSLFKNVIFIFIKRFCCINVSRFVINPLGMKIECKKFAHGCLKRLNGLVVLHDRDCSFNITIFCLRSDLVSGGYVLRNGDLLAKNN
jgi:hypothetical protein